MRLDLVLIYLTNRFLYRIGIFFVHWYWHTFRIIKYWVIKIMEQSFQKRNFARSMVFSMVIIIAVFIYALWALVPVYLIIRIFYNA